MIQIYVDADACPVKDEVYRVARRHGLPVHLVSNRPINLPRDPLFHPVVVSGRFDAADDWIVDQATASDIVVTADIPLAARCLAQGARVLDPKGRPFTDASIASSTPFASSASFPFFSTERTTFTSGVSSR